MWSELENSKQGWEALAAWYDKKQGEIGDLWHRSLIDPSLIRLVGDVNGKHVLDLGCGNGYLSRKFAREGGRISAVDSSPHMIELARSHDPDNKLGINYVTAKSNNLAPFANETFDLVFANMTLMDFEDGAGAISETSRVLRPSGRFVASISHPCFDNGRNSGWLMEKSLGESARYYRRIRAYRHLMSEEFPWRINDTEVQFTTGYHRPLNWYARAFKSAGLAITALEEPEPEKEFLEKESDGFCLLEVPLHIVFEVSKY